MFAIILQCALVANAVLFIIGASIAGDSPSASTTNFGEICNKNEDNFDGCLREKFQMILPKLDKGIPELNMPSIDPYLFKKGLFRYSNDGVDGGLLIKNMDIRGISKIIVNDIKSNFSGNNFLMRVNCHMPKINVNGSFKADVKFGGLRLVPKGLFNLTIDNVKLLVRTGGKIDNTAEGSRVQINQLNADVEIGSARLVANGIFSDRNLNTMILNLINENIPEIARVGIPRTRSQWAPIFIQHINKFFANVSMESIIQL